MNNNNNDDLLQFIFRETTTKVVEVQKMAERVEEVNNDIRESEEIEIDRSVSRSDDQADDLCSDDDSPSRHVILTL